MYNPVNEAAMLRTIETTALVGADHTITVKLPDDVPQGLCEVVVTVKDPVVKERVNWLALPPLDLVMRNPHDTFRREDIYGDEGR